jgi:hypothetical protein
MIPTLPPSLAALARGAPVLHRTFHVGMRIHGSARRTAAFCPVVEAGSRTKAARALGIVQPTVSKQIAQNRVSAVKLRGDQGRQKFQKNCYTRYMDRRAASAPLRRVLAVSYDDQRSHALHLHAAQGFIRDPLRYKPRVVLGKAAERKQPRGVGARLSHEPEIVLFGKSSVNNLLADHADVGNGEFLYIEVF